MPLIYVAADIEPPKQSFEVLHQMGCKACPLADCGARSPDMRPSGAADPLIYILGEAPGRTEDEEDRPFVGESGDFLWDCMPKPLWLGNVRVNNVVRTRPPDNRTPTTTEIECCRPSVQRDIETTRPRVVVAVGGTALTWATGLEGINAHRGRIIAAKIGDHACWVVPILHPAGILRQRDDEDGRIVMRHDLARAYRVAMSESPPVIEDPVKMRTGVELILRAGRQSADRIIRVLEDFRRHEKWVAVDIETASNEKLKKRKLRPYGEGARILSMTFSNGERTLAFALNHPECRWSTDDLKLIRLAVKDFLCDRSVHKIAHKAAFELEWLIVEFGVEVASAPWECSMMAAMTLDERGAGLDLDTCCQQMLGLALKSLVPVDRARMEQYDLPTLLLYNAMDAKYDVPLFVEQHQALATAGLVDVYHQRRRHIPTLVLAQRFGMHVDQDRVKGHHQRLGKEVRRIETKLADQPTIRTYEREHGTFNWASPDQVYRWISDTLGHRTKLKKKLGATDEEVLKEVRDPAAGIILDLREVSRLRSTYNESLMLPKGKHVWPDAMIHTMFNHDIARTSRLSSSDPNLQNYPARANKEMRDQLVALRREWADLIWKLMGLDELFDRDDCTLLSADYGAIEARVIAMASKCRVLTKAMRTNYDIHMDWTKRLAEVFPALVGGKQYLDDPARLKKLRTLVKNQWVFPAFYGARLESVAMFLGGVDVRKLEPIFRDFWREFQDVREWQDWVLGFYEDHGYVECLTGARRHGPLSLNQKINSPIQGTAAEIVLAAMDRLSVRARAGDWWLQARLNVHDDLTFYVPKAKLDHYHKIIVDEMLDARYDFLNVPLAIETKHGPDWFNMKEIGVYYQRREQVPLWT